MDKNTNDLPAGEQLYWAEHHAADPTKAQETREWFKKESERMRGLGITPVDPYDTE